MSQVIATIDWVVQHRSADRSVDIVAPDVSPISLRVPGGSSTPTSRPGNIGGHRSGRLRDVACRAVARMSPTARREAIVDAALSVAIRKGFGSTTVRDVSSELGCSSGLIHHYFDSMDEVLAAAFEVAAGRDLDVTSTAVAAEPTPRAQLMAFFASYARTDQDWSSQLWLDAWAEAARQPALGATSRRLNVAWQQLLAQIIERGVAAAEFRCDDPDGAAWRIVSMIDGLAIQNVAHGPMLPEHAILDWTLTTTEHELDLPHGALPRPGSVDSATTSATT